MRELYGHASVRQLWQNHGFFPCFFLKWDDVSCKDILFGVICHIQKSETYLAQAGVCCHEVATFYDTFDELVRQWFTCFIMESKGAQEFLFYGIVLHKLRWQLYEIPPYIGTRKTFEPGVGEHSVKAVTKLMQEGLYLSQGQEGRFFFCRLGEVHHYAHVWTNVVAFMVYPLSLEFCHPGSSLFALAWEEVCIEHSQITAVFIEYFVCLHVRMVYWNLFVFLEGNTIQFVG